MPSLFIISSRSVESRHLGKHHGTVLLFHLLLLSGDISQNPGPYWKYPCGDCSEPVKSNQAGIQCDNCDRWFHVRCCRISDIAYSAFANSSCSWIRCDCGLPNFSSSLFAKELDFSSTNIFTTLADKPTLTSTPTKFTRRRSAKPTQSKSTSKPNSRPLRRNLRGMIINSNDLKSSTRTTAF